MRPNCPSTCGATASTGTRARRSTSGQGNAPGRATARRRQREYGLALTLSHGNAERVPYPAASFDLAISEYGACLWADPYCWVPEAARLLRPGGALIFLVNSALLTLCMPEEDDL